MKKEKKKKKAIKPIAKSVGKGEKPMGRQKARSEKNPELRVLIIEDNPADAELMERQLKKGGIAFASRRVDTRSGFLQTLKNFSPDLILADYTLPKFNAMQALELARKKLPYIPFIVITGCIGEEKAVACLCAGADDYLLKDRLARLGEAVQHALNARRLQLEKMEAQETLAEQEARIQSIFRSAPIGIGVVSKRILLKVNAKICEMTGYSEDELIGQSARMLYPSDKEFKRVGKYKYDQIKKYGTGMIETQFMTKDGKPMEVLLSSTPIDPDDLSKGVTFTVLDISERKRQQEMVERSAKKWTATFDSITDGIALLAIDQTIRQANQAFADLVKKPFREIIGKKCYELIHSDCQPDTHCPFAKMLKSKKRESMELAIDDRVLEIVVDPIINDAGTVTGAVHIMSDITERRLAEEARRESEEQYRDLVEKGNIAIAVDDIDGNLIYFNDQFLSLFGYSAREIKGKTHKEFVHPDSFEMVSNYHKKRMQGENIPSRYEFKGIRKDGSIINVEIDVCEILKKAGKISGSRSYMWDITKRKKMEDELKDSEIRYHDLFENSSEFIFTLDLKGNFTDVNKAAQALSGYTKSELLKMNFKDYTPKRDHRKLFLALSNIYKTGKPLQNLLIEAIIKDKSKKYFETSIGLMKKGEQIIGFQGSSKDITDRKRAEEEIKKLSSMVEQSTEGMAIAGLDGILSFVNEAWCRMHGYKSSKELLGKSFAIFHDQEQMENEVKPFNEKVIEFGTCSGEVGHITRDGKLFPTLMTSTLLKDKQGMPYALAGIVKDITERKQAEEKIRESEEKFRSIVENSSDQIFLLDKNCKFLSANKPAADLLGKSPQEMIGMSVVGIFPESTAAQFSKNIKNVFATGKNMLEEEKILVQDRELYISTSLNPVIDDKGMVTAVTGIVRDITERKRAEEQIWESLREKEVLLKEIHHRVKNNLQIISGLLTLQAAQVNDERLQGMIKESQSRIWTMALIHQTLYQSGNLADIDMADYIRTLVGNLLSSHARIAMPPTVSFDLLPLRLSIDMAIPLALIINELVTNAMKHAFPDGRSGEIRITLQECRGTARRAPTYELTVSDNGIGLPAGFDAANQKSLGLQLVTMLVKQLGGSLAFASKDGTSVSIGFGNNEKNEKQS